VALANWHVTANGVGEGATVETEPPPPPQLTEETAIATSVTEAKAYNQDWGRGPCWRTRYHVATTANIANIANNTSIQSLLNGGLRCIFHQGAFAVVAALMVTVVLPPALTEPLGTEQVTSIKLPATEQLTVTSPLKLFCGTTDMLVLAELPG
jgi:hypothetical protein